MIDPIRYRSHAEKDIPSVSELVGRVFDRFIAPEYSDEGIREFRRYIQPQAFRERMHAGHFGLLAETGDRIAGMIEARGNDHVSLLFVDPEFHNRGIAKELLRQTVEHCRAAQPGLSGIGVNSSSYAVAIYEKLGFRRAGERQVRNGIGFIPMFLDLHNSK